MMETNGAYCQAATFPGMEVRRRTHSVMFGSRKAVIVSRWESPDLGKRMLSAWPIPHPNGKRSTSTHLKMPSVTEVRIHINLNPPNMKWCISLHRLGRTRSMEWLRAGAALAGVIMVP